MFTKELIDCVINYFQNEHGQFISEETAQLYLNSLADVFGSFSDLLLDQQNLRNYKNSDTIET